VRLGFSVAAHLDADILLVDEVLAVGDAAFQMQCYDRIGELRRAGTTMIIISHDLASISRLCDRVALMNRGELVTSGTPEEVIALYQQHIAGAVAMREVADAVQLQGIGAAKVTDVRFLSDEGTEVRGTTTGHFLRTRVEMDVTVPVNDAVIEVFYYSRDGRTLHCQQSTALSGEPATLERGRRGIEFTCAECGLQPGIYSIGAAVRERCGAATVDWWYGNRLLYIEPGKSVRGTFYAPHEWRWVDAAAEVERHPADV